jgi:hypothetical protein
MLSLLGGHLGGDPPTLTHSPVSCSSGKKEVHGGGAWRKHGSLDALLQQGPAKRAENKSSPSISLPWAESVFGLVLLTMLTVIG